MSWSAITYYEPFLSRKKRLGIVIGIVVLAMARIFFELLDEGFSTRFYLYAGFILVALVLEWKHYNKPREITLKIENGRLEYNNHYTAESHTVYKSRTQSIQENQDAVVFYSINNYATRIPLKFFTPEQVHQLKANISDWNN